MDELKQRRLLRAQRARMDSQRELKRKRLLRALQAEFARLGELVETLERNLARKITEKGNGHQPG